MTKPKAKSKIDEGVRLTVRLSSSSNALIERMRDAIRDARGGAKAKRPGAAEVVRLCLEEGVEGISNATRTEPLHPETVALLSDFANRVAKVERQQRAIGYHLDGLLRKHRSGVDLSRSPELQAIADETRKTNAYLVKLVREVASARNAKEWR